MRRVASVLIAVAVIGVVAAVANLMPDAFAARGGLPETVPPNNTMTVTPHELDYLPLIRLDPTLTPTATPTATATPEPPTPRPTPEPTRDPAVCAPEYPTVCIPPPPAGSGLSGHFLSEL